MWFIEHLLRPFDYLRIELEEVNLYNGKAFTEIALPIIISLTVSLLFLFNGIDFALIGDFGIFSSIKNMCQLLAAFFLAALAAIATFNNPHMSKPLRGANAVLSLWDNKSQEVKDKTLNRREYLLYLYGYLSWSCMIYVIITSIFESFYNYPIFSIGSDKIRYINSIFVFAGLALFLNITFTSLTGIVFLITRISSSDDTEDT